MITLSEIMGGYVLPAAILLIGTALIKRQPPTLRWRLCQTGMALLAFGLGYGQLQGWPGWIPIDSTQWLLHAGLLGLIVGLIARPGWCLWLLRLLLSVGLLVLLLRPIMQYDWTTTASVLWITGFGLLILGQMALLDHLDRKVEPLRLLLLLVLISGSTSLILGLSGSVSLAKIAGLPTVMLAVFWALSLWRPPPQSASLWLPFAVTITSGLWLSGHYYAELNAPNALLLLASIPLAWVGLWCQLEHRPLWLRLILHALLPALPLGIAFVRALLAFIQNEANAYY